jgi:hypothetical protein
MQAISELCVAVDGLDWDAARVQACVTQARECLPTSRALERDEALGLIAARLRSATVEAADGVAYAAITGGTLVEAGAHTRAFALALLARLPEVLRAARRFADTCLAPLRGLPDPWAGVDAAEVLSEVDGLPLTRAALREHVGADPAGASSLARLNEWVLPTVAALTRDRTMLVAALHDGPLVAAAAALRRSEASWLHRLLATQLEAPWRIALLEPRRVFEVRVDGVCTNFELQELVELALASVGVPTLGRSSDGAVRGSFELLTWRALPFLPGAVPAEHLVYGEGVPTDVPAFEGQRTLLATTPTALRTWRSTQPFSELVPRIELLRERSATEAAAVLEALERAASFRD